VDKPIEKLFEALGEIVRGDGTFREKKAKVLEAAGSGTENETNLQEFLAWFEP